MKAHTEHLTLNVPTGSYTNLTDRVQAAIDKCGVREGLVLVNRKRRIVQAVQTSER